MIRNLVGITYSASGENLKRFEHCVIHIGCIKTGSTSIQKFLSLNRHSLMQEGTYYPQLTHPKGESQLEFALAFQDNPQDMHLTRFSSINTSEKQLRFQSRLKAWLEKEFASAPNATRLILSSEHFHSNFLSEHSVRALKAFLNQWVDTFTVVCYLRRQDEMAVSHYSTLLKDGQRIPKVFPVAQSGQLPVMYDFYNLYQRWASAFGEHSMRFNLYGKKYWPEGELLLHFCQVAGIELKEKIRPELENTSLNKTGQDFILALNDLVPRILDGKPNPERMEIVGLVAKMCSGQSIQVSKAEAQAFYTQFKEGNEALHQLDVIQGIGNALGNERPNQGLFEENFDQYPDKNTLKQPHYTSAVGLALALYQASKRKGGGLPGEDSH